MSEWYAFARFPLSMDMAQVNRVLTEEQVIHRFTEEQNCQFLWLLNQDDQSRVYDLLKQWQDQQLPDDAVVIHNDSSGDLLRSALAAALIAPLSALFIVLGILGAVFVELIGNDQISAFAKLTFYPFSMKGQYYLFQNPWQAIAAGQVWRLITPVFFHFGLLHITYNAIFLWLLGWKIETVLGGWRFLGLFLTAGLGGNMVQALWYGPSIFGGLSGVVFGLLGFIVVWQWRVSDTVLRIHPYLIILMTVSLAIGLFGPVDVSSDERIAKGAHLGGLISGALLALLTANKSAERAL